MRNTTQQEDSHENRFGERIGERPSGRRDLQGGELLVEGGLVALELRGVVLGGLAPGRAPLLLLPRAVPHRSSQPESERERRGRAGGRRRRPPEQTNSGAAEGDGRGAGRSALAGAWRRAGGVLPCGFGMDGLGARRLVLHDCRVGPPGC